jgi:hypothetical protein
MDITYCNDVCPIGKAARDKFLEINNSAFDAATDFRFFTDSCYKACQFKDEHQKREQEGLGENI